MKHFILFMAILFAGNLSAQTRFRDNADVLIYLDNKTFRNDDYDAKARFKDAATVMIINDNGVCVLPQVRIISSYKAIVSYTYQANPSIHPEYIVNSLENTLTNPQNDRVYKLARY
jgi:hypothetical protein